MFKFQSDFVVGLIPVIFSLVIVDGEAREPCVYQKNATNLLPWGAEECESRIIAADDAESLQLFFRMSFSEGVYDNLFFASNNGLIQFQDRSSTPASSFRLLPDILETSANDNIAFVIPYLGDTDTRDTSGSVYFGPQDNIRYVLTWDDVGYFKEKKDKTNRFQLVMRSLNPEGDFELEFRYNKLEWGYPDLQASYSESSTSEDGMRYLEAVTSAHPFVGIIDSGRIAFELPLSQRSWVQKSHIYNGGIWTVRTVNNTYSLLLDNNLECRHTITPTEILPYPGSTLPEAMSISTNGLSTLPQGSSLQSSVQTLPFSIRLTQGGELTDRIRVHSNGVITICPDDVCTTSNSDASSVSGLQGDVIAAFLASVATDDEGRIYYGQLDSNTYVVRWEGVRQLESSNQDNPENTFTLILARGANNGDFEIRLHHEELNWPAIISDTLSADIPFSGVLSNGNVVMELPLSRQQRALSLAEDYNGLWTIQVIGGEFALELPRNLSCTLAESQ